MWTAAAVITVAAPDLGIDPVAVMAAEAYGAKLTGAGRGGCALALVTPERAAEVAAAMQAAGASWVRTVAVAAT